MSVALALPKHTAAGPYLGYALQPVRLCHHLLHSDPDASVSLEYIDDVAIHLPNGDVVREQDKSAISRKNPLSDWAEDLWNTIAYWMKEIQQSKVAAGYRYYVTPPKPAIWSQTLSDAKTAADVAAVTETILAAVKRKRTAPACMPDLQIFLDASDADRAALITRLEIINCDNDPLTPIRKKFELWLDPTFLDDVCAAVIGFAKAEIDQLHRDKQPPLIEARRFQARVRAYIRKINLPGLLPSLTPRPDDADVASLIATRRTFIRQLEIIEVEQNDLLRAASDFMRASADLAKWAERGQIFEDDVEDWNADLVRRHAAISGELRDTARNEPPEVRGRLTYRRCSLQQVSLQGREVPGHVTHGGFNGLADNMKLGWHPDYLTLMEQVE